MFNLKNKETNKRLLSCIMLSLAVMHPEASYANELEDVVTGGLCEIIEALTGDVGKAVATLAVLFLGIGAFFGKVNWGLALMFAAGIVAIFGAAAIAGQIAVGAGGAGGALTCGGGEGQGVGSG